MRRALQLLMILSVAACLYACKKDRLTASAITGKWELRFAFNGSVSKYYSPGNGNTYTFNIDGTFVQNDSTKVVNQGTYAIKNNAVQINDISYNELLLNGATSGPVVQVQDTTLSLGLEYNNGSGGVYTKIK